MKPSSRLILFTVAGCLLACGLAARVFSASPIHGDTVADIGTAAPTVITAFDGRIDAGVGLTASEVGTHQVSNPSSSIFGGTVEDGTGLQYPYEASYEATIVADKPYPGIFRPDLSGILAQ